MRANEFIKKFGWEVAKRTLVNADGCDFIKIQGGYEFKFDELKSYIDAYELVQSYGGLSRSRRWVERTVFKLSDSMIALKNAITLVEECQ